MVLLHLLLEHLQDEVVLQWGHLCGAPVLGVPLLEHWLVGWVLEVCQLVPHEADLDGNSTSKTSESELTTTIGLLDFLEAFLPLPASLPFVSALCSEVVLCFPVLGVTGMSEDRCTDCDLILGLPALEIDAVGLSAIRHFTIY